MISAILYHGEAKHWIHIERIEIHVLRTIKTKHDNERSLLKLSPTHLNHILRVPYIII